MWRSENIYREKNQGFEKGLLAIDTSYGIVLVLFCCTIF